MGDTSEKERSVPMEESVEEVRGKSKKKEGRYGRRYGFATTRGLTRGLEVCVLRIVILTICFSNNRDVGAGALRQG
jgi:hypothetical protein